MIPRYSLPEMTALWSDQHKLDLWKEVETLVVEAWVAEGVAPAEAADAVRAAPPVSAEAWPSGKRSPTTTWPRSSTSWRRTPRSGGEWVHYGLTSSDVLDTAGGVRLAEATDLLLAKVARLFDVVKAKAVEHRHTVMIGRTHGIWAEPTTFGLKLATWAFELAQRPRAPSAPPAGRWPSARSVGRWAPTPIHPSTVEAFVCGRLGLGIEEASSQITHRDRHAELLQAIAITGASIERFATEIRHLQRSEVGEAREAFGKNQKGSSAMPHKRNPILSERMTGMARVLRGYAQVGLENIALWHERDISHSSAERIILPDACVTLDYMAAKFAGLVEALVVDDARMIANLEATRGLVFSQAVLLQLVETGYAPRRRLPHRAEERHAGVG